MKPQIRNHSEDSFTHWADGMSRLANQTTAYCKYSGLVTESDGWSLEGMRPYVEHLLKTFGSDRLMWGSDWPVCRLEASYDAWHSAAHALTVDLSQAAQDRIFGGTAQAFYRL